MEVKPIFMTAWAVNRVLFHIVRACFVYHVLITSVLNTVLFQREERVLPELSLMACEGRS